jgi:hypothetical protein
VNPTAALPTNKYPILNPNVQTNEDDDHSSSSFSSSVLPLTYYYY